MKFQIILIKIILIFTCSSVCFETKAVKKQNITLKALEAPENRQFVDDFEVKEHGSLDRFNGSLLVSNSLDKYEEKVLSKMMDRLVEIEPMNLQNLKNLYTSDDKERCIAYMTIDNYQRWFNQDSNLKHVKILTLNGDFSDGTFVITDRCSAFADTINGSFDRLTRLLQLIDYSKGYAFHSIRTDVRQILLNVLQWKNIELDYAQTTLFYHLPKEKALDFDVRPPEDIELRPVTEPHDLEKANSVFPHLNTNSIGLFQRLAKYNPNVGAFKKDDGTLVAWIFCLHTGTLRALQTDENYYGKGYAALVVKYLSKKIAEMGHDVSTGIFEENTASRCLFEKLGFQSIGDVHWISTKITWSSADE